MTEAWAPGAPWMQYDGSNGEAIAAAMTEQRYAVGPEDERKSVLVNTDHEGPALSLSQRWPNGTVFADRWRVPVGFWVNPASGECRDAAGVLQDFDALTADE